MSKRALEQPAHHAGIHGVHSPCLLCKDCSFTSWSIHDRLFCKASTFEALFFLLGHVTHLATIRMQQDCQLLVLLPNSCCVSSRRQLQVPSKFHSHDACSTAFHSVNITPPSNRIAPHVSFFANSCYWCLLGVWKHLSQKALHTETQSSNP